MNPRLKTEKVSRDVWVVSVPYVTTCHQGDWDFTIGRSTDDSEPYVLIFNEFLPGRILLNLDIATLFHQMLGETLAAAKAMMVQR